MNIILADHKVWVASLDWSDDERDRWARHDADYITRSCGMWHPPYAAFSGQTEITTTRHHAKQLLYLREITNETITSCVHYITIDCSVVNLFPWPNAPFVVESSSLYFIFPHSNNWPPAGVPTLLFGSYRSDNEVSSIVSLIISCWSLSLGRKTFRMSFTLCGSPSLSAGGSMRCDVLKTV